MYWVWSRIINSKTQAFTAYICLFDNYVLFEYDCKTSPAEHYTKCVIHFISVGSDFLCKTISLERWGKKIVQNSSFGEEFPSFMTVFNREGEMRWQENSLNKTSCQYYCKNTWHHEWQGRLWRCVRIKPHASIIIKILDIMNGVAGVMTLCKNKTSCQYYYKNTGHHEWRGRDYDAV